MRMLFFCKKDFYRMISLTKKNSSDQKVTKQDFGLKRYKENIYNKLFRNIEIPIKKRGIYKGEKIVDALKYILIRGRDIYNFRSHI